jgi:hypothetical protein
MKRLRAEEAAEAAKAAQQAEVANIKEKMTIEQINIALTDEKQKLKDANSKEK